MLRSTLLLALVGLSAATKSNNFNTRKAHQKGLALPGAGSQALVFSLTGSCLSSEIECDGGCIPSAGQCCDIGTGAYCEDGYYCISNGCCPDGEICSGAPSGCLEGKELCGIYCIPEGKVCCDTGYCDEGETCTSDGQCSLGGDGGGSGGGSGGNNCYSFQEECDDGCMPEGSVCCGNGKYCLSGETCMDDGTCRYGSGSGGSGGGSGDDGDDDDDSFSFTEVSFTEPSFTEPTFTEPSFTEPTFSAPSFTEPTLDPIPTIDAPTLSNRDVLADDQSFVVVPR
ncbi:hypothetical protein ACJZ2D_013765 [Fusarium nematophilum]